MRRAMMVTTGTALAAVLIATAPMAAGRGGGGDDGDVRVAGRCSMGSTAKLALSPEDGRVEVELEVDENRVGSRWGVALNRNGTPVARRAATTRRPSGSFEVRRVVAPGSPRTVVTAVARRAATGEVCRARAVI